MLKLEVTFDEINYAEFAAGLIPMFLENLSGRDDKSKEVAALIANLGDAPGRMLEAAFRELPQQDMNNLLAGMVTLYREELMNLANDKLKEQNISGGITDIRLDNV